MVALCEEFLGLLDDVGSKLIWLFIDFSNPDGEDNANVHQLLPEY